LGQSTSKKSSSSSPQQQSSSSSSSSNTAFSTSERSSEMASISSPRATVFSSRSSMDMPISSRMPIITEMSLPSLDLAVSRSRPSARPFRYATFSEIVIIISFSQAAQRAFTKRCAFTASAITPHTLRDGTLLTAPQKTSCAYGTTAFSSARFAVRLFPGVRALTPCSAPGTRRCG